MSNLMDVIERDKMIRFLIEEVDDAIAFMETMSIFADEFDEQRKQDKYDAILKALKLIGFRECTECEKGMSEGYCIENGLEYYCSDECLLQNMTWDEYMELYDNGEGDSFWTEWSEHS